MEPQTVINLIINKKHYQVHVEQMTGADLKRLGEIPPANLLFLDVPGPGEDQQIHDDTVVQLRDGDSFYDMPQGNFGSL
jgi:hypothetical protein